MTRAHRFVDPATGRGYAVCVLAVAAVAWIVARSNVSWWWLPVVTSAAALPTGRRLGALGLPRWPATLMAAPPIAPVVAALLLVGSRSDARRPTLTSEEDTRTTIRAAAVAIAVTAVLGVGVAYLATNVAQTYGWALFVTLPFALGFVATLAVAAAGRRSLEDAIGVTLVALGAIGVALVLVALEGVICLVMAAPLAAAVGTIGAIAAHVLLRSGLCARPNVMCAVAVAAPALLAGEATGSSQPPLIRVSTSIVVDAPPATVWRHVVSFRPLPAPHGLPFRLGVAYPTGASINGVGVGAVRRCRFSTGDFVEPITNWDPPHRLAFDVTEQPAPMKELSPYGRVRAPHLDGFLLSERGEFRLTPLAGERTLLVGTTWYRNRMWPTIYWRQWSDPIIHRIHRRVLEHVAAEAAAEGHQST